MTQDAKVPLVYLQLDLEADMRQNVQGWSSEFAGTASGRDEMVGYAQADR
jgi:hypothetical protein